MQISQAECLALELMRKHLDGQGWSLKFDNAKRRFGVCRYRSKVISLSIPLVRLNGLDEVKDTILHEIAHAIAGHKAGHGAKWRAVCVAIGARPERCYDGKTLNTPPAKYTATCKGCDTIHKRHRKPKMGSACGQCCAGTYNPNFILIFKTK